jgi:hypothetical protein
MVVDPEAVLGVGPDQMSTNVSSGARSDEHTQGTESFPVILGDDEYKIPRWSPEDLGVVLGALPTKQQESKLGDPF